jgi:hypothetical protein
MVIISPFSRLTGTCQLAPLSEKNHNIKGKYSHQQLGKYSHQQLGKGSDQPI